MNTKNIKTFGPAIDEPDDVQVIWSDAYEIGVDIIDEQHMRYFELVNRYLEQAVVYADAAETLDRLVFAFEFLVNYAEEHFVAEESIMKKVDYPDFDDHKAEHQYFRKHVTKLRREMEHNGLSLSLAREVNFYIVEWFTQHILSVDTRLADFLDKSSVELDPKEFAI